MIRRIGGATAIGVSVALVIVVAARNVDFNVANLWTIVLGVVGGALALLRPKQSVIAAVALIAAALPAMIGGLGLLYVVPVGLILAPSRARTVRRTASTVERVTTD